MLWCGAPLRASRFLQVAAEFVMRRVAGVTVTPHYCPIQDKDAAWYRQFQVIVLGLDSIEVRARTARMFTPSLPAAARPRVLLPMRCTQARRWLNAMACALVTYETDDKGVRKPDLTSVIPLVDGGTEGFSGHVRAAIQPTELADRSRSWL